jgi:hypothetical protein
VKEEDRPLQHRANLRPLILAAVAETICIVAGVVGFLATGRVIWIVIGVLAGIGFSAPAVIRLRRQSKDDDRASR